MSHVRILIPKSKNDNEFTLGVIYDKLIYARRGISYSYDLINVTGSYQKRIKRFFIGPQLGAGLYSEDWFQYTGLNFFIGQESGFQQKNLTFAFDYRFNSGDGFVFGEQIHLFSLKAGFRF